jgi:phage gp46-like protein
MSERMSRLCDELRIKLHGIDRRLEALKSNGVATFDISQEVLESRLDRVEQRIYDNRVTVEAANVRVKAWLAEKKAGSVVGHPLWTERHKAHLMEVRADDAETYAIADFELAAAAADEATLAVLQALLARNDADVVVLCETEPL